ncbi:30S ribosomal protein THX [Saccharicrinis sp. 156]|uniref:30S ribosomal protein THX n=1 Tax=Saccharicrinis sp. 156 TaxID=3417574 RepID=UPI003D338F1A
MGKGDLKTRRGKIFNKSYGKHREKGKFKRVYSPKNMTCYVSKEKLTKANKSLEHIIPNAFGGKLKSFHLLNSYWNEKFGKTIDKTLIKQVPLPTLLSVNRDRGQNPKIAAYSKGGNKYLIGENSSVEQRPSKPIQTTLENGKISIKFIKGQEDGILRSLKKNNPDINIDEIRKQIKWDNSKKEVEIFFENKFTAITGKDAFRAITKIIVNFYVFSTNEITEVADASLFIKGDFEWNNKIKYYYPNNKNIHSLGRDEVSHLIYIKGNQKEKLLIGYLELFSTYNFLIILNDDYNGRNVEFSYCYDLTSDREIKKGISLILTKPEVDKMNFPQDHNTESEFQKKVDRLMKIKGMKGITKLISNK